MIRPLSTAFREDVDARARKVLVIVMICASLMSLFHRSSAASSFRAWALSPFEPVLVFSGAVRSALVESTGHRSLGASDHDLRARLSVAEVEAANLANELNSLRSTLALPLKSRTRGVVADITGVAGGYNHQSMMLSRGSSHRVKRGAAVLAAVDDEVALIGRVIESGPTNSKALTLVDPAFRSAAKIGEHGGFLISGTSDGRVRLDFVPRDFAVEPGDKVYTSDEGTLFPAGLLIGEVTEVLPGPGVFSEIIVEPAVSLAEIRYAWIVQS